MIRRMFLLVVTAFAFICLSGCQYFSRNKSGVEVVIEGDGEFPDFLVGTWKADKGGWEITFEPTGNISSIVHNFGRRRLKPGEINDRPTRFGGKSVYEPGQWVVHYSPKSNELMVEIVIKHFMIEMKGGALKAKITDMLVGPVSEEQWQAEWFNFPEYTAFIPEPHELPVDFNNNPKESLIFKKIVETE